jgi:hypothetical protein
VFCYCLSLCIRNQDGAGGPYWLFEQTFPRKIGLASVFFFGLALPHFLNSPSDLGVYNEMVNIASTLPEIFGQ